MITTSRSAAGAASLPAAPAVIFAILGLIDIALLDNWCTAHRKGSARSRAEWVGDLDT